MLVFHDYLQKRFPLVHANMQVTKVNLYALAYHWQGSEDSLKPILFTAHQDVVPVNPDSLDDWIHPPYSGYFDGKWIWGRGSCDDKSGLIGTLTAMEMLLQDGFKPKRSVVLAYGIDEEKGGNYGAEPLAEYLTEVYGENSFALLVDEGGRYDDNGEIIMAAPSVAEKGYMDVQIEVTTLGGHSSRPPVHTGIGFLSHLITTLEAHPFPTALLRNGTYFASLECAAAHDPTIPTARRELIKAAMTNDAALSKLHADMLAEDTSGMHAVMTGTTQAIDLIGGGVKINALPERTWAIANHRIADWSSTADLRARYVSVLAPAASALNLTFSAFESKPLPPAPQAAHGHVRVSQALEAPLEPAPVTPTYGSAAWTLLAGTIRGTLASALRTDVTRKPSIVQPGMTTGNTDTRYYWGLTPHIFRYKHSDTKDAYNGAHTINEAMNAESLLEMVRFYARLVLNADENDDL